MNSARDICYTLIDNSHYQKMTETHLKYSLEYGCTEAKINALKEIIVSIANGDINESYLILIIRFILPMQDHTIKKLLLIFWELYPKVSHDGELIKEMILVCDAFRKDLQHPNEFVRGSILRFLCKLKQPEILEPLIGAIRANLNHKRSYVRRNAILAIYTIYKNYDNLIPDGSELMEEFLNHEKDTSCKRNAFIMLLNTDIDKAVNYLISSLDQVSSFDQSLQIVVIELIQKICQKNSHEKSAFIRCIYTLLDSKNLAVSYEAGRALIMLTNAPTALKASISCYINIILKADDNITKLIVLDHLVDMKYRLQQKRMLQEAVSDILALLPRNNDIKVKIKIINLVLDLINENNTGQIIVVLQKEFTRDNNSTDYINYKIFLTQKLHNCCLTFPQTATEIIPFLNELLSIEIEEKVLFNILVELKEAAEKFELNIPIIIDKLKDLLSKTPWPNIYRKALWILAEYSDNKQDMESIIEEVYNTMKQLRKYITSKSSENVTATSKDRKYNETQSLVNLEIKGKFGNSDIVKPLVEDIQNGTGFMSAAIGSSIGKLILRYRQILQDKVQSKPSLSVKALHIITIFLHLNRCNKNSDSSNRLANSLTWISEPKAELNKTFLNESKRALLKMFLSTNLTDKEDSGSKRVQVMQPDEPVRLLEGLIQSPYKDLIEFDSFEEAKDFNKEQSYKLDKVIQLTGFSDPIYSETKLVHTSEHNIALHVILINRTNETLQNCFVELVSTGDLVITDKPQPKTLGPNGKAETKINVKVALTGNSIIFGNIVYDTANIIERSTIVLNDISIDVIDYIKPSDCGQEEFRKMWLEFEWENKVYLTPKHVKDLMELLNLIAKHLRMKCLTPKEAMSGESRFLSANLLGVSIFGESVIANLSLEKNLEGDKITGHIRLRSKSQGIVLSLGDIVRFLPC